MSKMPHVTGNEIWTLIQMDGTYPKIDIIVRMIMIFQVLTGKTLHQKFQLSLCLFLQFLKEELCQYLGLMLILAREQVHILSCFVRHTKILGNSGEIEVGKSGLLFYSESASLVPQWFSKVCILDKKNKKKKICIF